jgi:apolipoprotein N-acyltransferase
MNLPALLAANVTALDKLKEMPAEIWLKLGLGVIGLIMVVIILRKIAKVNKVVLGIVIVVGLSFLGFNWIYNRTEPAWATPYVEPLSHFFPTKGPIKQKDLPK